MPTIKKLSNKVINLIAAGEVVERPSNIIKELVENAIDAEAQKISIQIYNAGLNKIIVIDNGIGMDEDDIILAYQQHTTSKLSDSSISSVATLGFRGEALASIAAVSKVVCKSKTHSMTRGREIRIEGGKIIRTQTTDCAIGTSIEVSSIFFNTPARRKFLKTSTTERRHVIDLLTNFAIFYPKIHFQLEEINKKGKKITRLNSPLRKNQLEAIYDVLGIEIGENLIKVDRQLGQWNISGFISKPILTKPDRSFQFLNVNGRVIRHITLQKSIENAYGSQLLRSTYPIIVLTIQGAPELIDFNVHPQKAEIRFRQDDPIFNEIQTLIKDTLTEYSILPELPSSKIENIVHSGTTVNLENQSSSKEEQRSEIKNDQVIKIKDELEFIQSSLLSEEEGDLSHGIRVLGHIMKKFGLIVYKNELWLVDIHAADERVKFEKYEKSSHRKAFKQELLTPLEVNLTPSEIQILLDHIDILSKYGIRITPMNQNSLFVHSSPVYFDQQISGESIKSLLEDLASYFNSELDESKLIDTPLSYIEYGIVARLSCHGSIRSGKPVSNQVILEVVNNILECKNPWTCAHGRPTILRLPKSKLESWFRR